MKSLTKKPLLYYSVLITLISALLLCSCRSNKAIEELSSSAPSSVPIPASSEEPISVAEPADNGIRLVISSPNKSSVSVTDPNFVFSGTSDPAEPLAVNGTEIERGADGIFTYQTELKVGKNTFSFTHKGETKTYTVSYRYVIINSFSPSGAQTYPSGSTLVVNVYARNGSTVSASLNGNTVNLTRENTQQQDGEFVPYNGVFRLPSDNAQDINLGKITFKATHNGKSETFTSGKIICKTGTSIYQKRHKSFEPFNLKWHYYYMCRTTNCPVVLTENGYISNSFDYGNIISDAKNTEKAKAITRGIVNYFNSIQ